MAIEHTFDAAYDVIKRARLTLADPNVDEATKTSIHIHLSAANRHGTVDLLDAVYGDEPITLDG